jgi:hypothetical protein
LDPKTETYTKKSFGVKNKLIQNVFSLNRDMLFLFDYGEDWLFLVTCIQIIANEEKRKFIPLIIKDLNKGKTPNYHNINYLFHTTPEALDRYNALLKLVNRFVKEWSVNR